MPPIREQAIDRIRRDHEHMIELAERIKALCTLRGDCLACRSDRRQVCHGDISYLIRALVEATQKHHLIESLLMQDGVPHAHRIAHSHAHMTLVDQIRAIRVKFSDDGNCISAIDGIDEVLRAILAHFEEFDQQLETYLFAPARAEMD